MTPEFMQQLRDTEGWSVQESEPVSKSQYMSLLGSLMFAAITCRPDLAFSVCMLSQWGQDPRQLPMTGLVRVLRYLIATKTARLQYRGTIRSTQPCLYMDVAGLEDLELAPLDEEQVAQALVAAQTPQQETSEPEITELESTEPEIYTDSDWGSDTDGLSRAGWAAKLAGGAISWYSKKLQLVALSSAEAEYKALGEGVKEAIWLRQLLGELQLPTGPVENLL